jgi:hypothetical protein
MLGYAKTVGRSSYRKRHRYHQSLSVNKLCTPVFGHCLKNVHRVFKKIWYYAVMISSLSMISFLSSVWNSHLIRSLHFSRQIHEFHSTVNMNIYPIIIKSFFFVIWNKSGGIWTCNSICQILSGDNCSVLPGIIIHGCSSCVFGCNFERSGFHGLIWSVVSSMEPEVSVT